MQTIHSQENSYQNGQKRWYQNKAGNKRVENGCNIKKGVIVTFNEREYVTKLPWNLQLASIPGNA